MRYGLREHVSFCDVAGRLVFLDCAADRYFCLDEAAEADFRHLLDGAGHPGLQAAAARLTAYGLLVPGRAIARPCVPPAMPTASLLDRDEPAGLGATALAAAALIASIARLRACAFSSNLAAAARARTRIGEQPPPAALAAIAAAFARGAVWLSSRDRCLPQSLAVARAARRAGFAVDIVFGVSLGPFEAHCWVQHGGTVVNDRVEVVRRFVPILVR